MKTHQECNDGIKKEEVGQRHDDLPKGECEREREVMDKHIEGRKKKGQK